MSYRNKHITEIIEILSENSLENEIKNNFFNLFGLTITYSHYDMYCHMIGYTRIKEIFICAECTYGNLIYDDDEINEVSDEGFLKMIKQFIKGEYYLSIEISKYHMFFGFGKYQEEEILELKNMNICENYWKYNEKCHDEFVENQKYLYTRENLDELTYKNLFKLVNNDQYVKNSYFNNMKNQKCDVCFWFF